MTTMTTDTTLRTLERTWNETQADADAIAFRRALLRAGQQVPYRVESQAVEAEARVDAVGKIARVWSSAGPCFTSGVAKSGRIVRETAKFFVTESTYPGDRGKQTKIAKNKVHLVACHRCADHPKSDYPGGYQD